MDETKKMNPVDVKSIVGSTPQMSLQEAKILTEFIHKYNIKNVLELGFRHGVSTCYIAAALDANGGGSVVTIDLESTKQAKPNIEELLEKTDQINKVKIYYEPSSYTWRLMKLLEDNPKPCFDFCYLDGAHSWAVDGLAFFLVDKLLKLNGWLLFDDINWSYATSLSLKDKDWVKAMPEDERNTCQVLKIYDLLVKTHPCYGNFTIADNWGFAQKVKLIE